MMEEDDDDDDIPTILVGGEEVDITDVTPDIIARMTTEEMERYNQVCPVYIYFCSSPAKKIRPLEKKLGRKPAPPPPQTIRRSVVTIFVCKLLGQFLPISVKIRPQLGNLELGRFLGR
jgi:hypothetical protein